MRKVTAICVHDNMKRIYNLSVVTSQGITVELVRYKKEDEIKPYCYSDFQDLYKSVLNLLKQNNFITFMLASIPLLDLIFIISILLI